MKRRTKRDFTVFLGAIAVIGGIAFVNTQLSRGNLAKEFEEKREELEAEVSQQSNNLIKWTEMRKTKCTLHKGGTFVPELLEMDGDRVQIIGFQVAMEQFRNISEFTLLPIPLECYFCAMPPSRDVLLVTMAEGESTSIFQEPVLLEGTLTINEGPGQKFFYTLKDTYLKAALDGGELTKKRLQLQHMLGGSEHPGDEPDLLEPSKRRFSDTD